jgi:hypothetical protein
MDTAHTTSPAVEVAVEDAAPTTATTPSEIAAASTENPLETTAEGSTVLA